MRNKIFLGWLLMFFLSAAVAQADPGETGAAFLKMGDGARAAGMGEAHAALAEGAAAIYWNPAGLGMTRNAELTLTHLSYLEDATQQYAAFAAPLRKGRRGTLGFSFTRFAITNIETRDAQSAKLSGTVEQEDRSLQVSYGLHLGGDRSLDSRGFFVGVSAKQISETLATESASTTAFDAGVQYRPGDGAARKMGEWSRRLTLGLSALNMGSGLTFDKEETPLPRETRLGLAYTHFLWGDMLNLVADWTHLSDSRTQLSGGAEFWVKNMLALRAGMVEGQDIGSAFRLGAGFRFQNIQADYALANFGEELGDTHRVTLTMRFGEGAATRAGLRTDLVSFHLVRAREALEAASYHEAVLEANHVLEIDARNTEALRILFEAGEKMKPQESLPAPVPQEPPVTP